MVKEQSKSSSREVELVHLQLKAECLFKAARQRRKPVSKQRGWLGNNDRRRS